MNPEQQAIEAKPRRESVMRVIAVTRLHFVNKWGIMVLPMIIMAGILAINLVIWAAIIAALSSEISRAHAEKGFSYSGSVFFIFVYATIVAVQAMSRTFPFSLGYGVTRRDFYLGSSLAFLILAVGFSAILTIMSSIEIATGGWGLGGHMFTPSYFTQPSWLLRFVLFFLALLFCLFIGSAIASVWARWKSTGVVTFFAALAILIAAFVSIATLSHGWADVADWFASAGLLGVAAWSLVPTVIACVAGFFILRRATPRT